MEKGYFYISIGGSDFRLMKKFQNPQEVDQQHIHFEDSKDFRVINTMSQHNSTYSTYLTYLTYTTNLTNKEQT